MPCIAIGPEDEEEEESPSRILWATSCTADGKEVEEEGEEDREQDAAPAAPSSWVGKRVIFLEIDGILNTKPDPRMVVMERVPCAQLRTLLDASKAEIVLTSKWRKHYEYIAEVLTNFGALPENWTAEMHRAPWNANKDRRDLEILQWVNSHRDIAGWVALDARDLLRFPSAARLEGHTIQVDPLKGLTSDIVAAALRVLGCHGSNSTGDHSPDLVSTSCARAEPFEFAPSASGRQSSLSAMATVALDPDFDPVDDKPSAPGRQGPSSLEAIDTDMMAGLRAALSWDDDLASKMQDLLGSLPKDSKEVQFPRSDSSRAEFEAVREAAAEKFKKLPAK